MSDQNLTQPGSMSPDSSSPDADSIRGLVDRIAESPQFRKSRRQQQLLRYLVERSTASPRTEIQEREIGTAVFGRKAEFDTSTDNIVRVNVYDLRKRLQAYFAEEGQSEPFVMEIPKGGYSPEFRLRESLETPASPAEIETVSPEPKPASRFIAPALVLVLLVLCLWLVAANRSLSNQITAQSVSPELQKLWSRMFLPGRATDIVVADSNLSFLRDALPSPLEAEDYFRGSFLPNDLSPLDRKLFDRLMSRRYTSMADVHVLQRLNSLRRPGDERFTVYFARDFSPENLKTSNVVLLGSKRSNPWVEYFETGLNFRTEHDASTGYGVIVNAHPRPGEQPTYKTLTKAPMIETYGVVAFVPNLSRTGSVLILEGAGMHATEAAGELVTRADLWSGVLRALDVRSEASLPHFEVLFKTGVLGAAMQPPKVIAVRIKTEE